MRVKQIMTADVRHGNRCTSVDEAICLMKINDSGFLPIVDEETRGLIGVVTDRDVLLRAVYGHLDVRLMPVTDVMTESLVTIRPEDTLERAVRVMASHQLRRLPVVSPEGELAGVLSLTDIVRSDAVPPKAIVTALRKITAPPKAHCVNRSLLLKTCAA